MKRPRFYFNKPGFHVFPYKYEKKQHQANFPFILVGITAKNIGVKPQKNLFQHAHAYLHKTV